jgi:hypothetical protein
MKDTPMTLKERVRLFEEDSKILEKIAKQYDEGSKEYSAVRHAAIALWYALTEGHQRFREYVAKFEGDLTREQRASLIQMGIDPYRSEN